MTRREHLRILLDRVQRELAAEEARVARIAAIKAQIDVPPDEEPCGLFGDSTRRNYEDTYTADEAREAHAMHSAGNREPWVVEAERQYQRARKRASRQRLSA